MAATGGLLVPPASCRVPPRAGHGLSPTLLSRQGEEMLPAVPRRTRDVTFFLFKHENTPAPGVSGAAVVQWLVRSCRRSGFGSLSRAAGFSHLEQPGRAEERPCSLEQRRMTATGGLIVPLASRPALGGRCPWARRSRRSYRWRLAGCLGGVSPTFPQSRHAAH